MLDLLKPLHKTGSPDSFLGIGNLRGPPRHLHHVLDIILEIDRFLQYLLDVIQFQSLVTITSRDRGGREQYVSDLAPVEVFEGRAVVFFFVVQPGQQFLLVTRVVVRELLNEVLGDGFLLFIIEIFVSYGEVYARLDGYVERADSIRGQDQDSVVVFEDT